MLIAFGNVCNMLHTFFLRFFNKQERINREFTKKIIYKKNGIQWNQ